VRGLSDVRDNDSGVPCREGEKCVRRTSLFVARSPTSFKLTIANRTTTVIV